MFGGFFIFLHLAGIVKKGGDLMNLLFISVSHSALADLFVVKKELEISWPSICKINFFYGGNNLAGEKTAKLLLAIQEADFLFLDLMGAPNKLQEQILEQINQCSGFIFVLGGEKRELVSCLKLGRLRAKDLMTRDRSIWGQELLHDWQNYSFIAQYWKNAGLENIKNLIYLILRDYGQKKEIPQPSQPYVLEGTGIYDFKKENFCSNLAQYKQENFWDEEKPTVAFLFYSQSYPNRTIGCLKELAKKICLFANILPVAFASVSSRNLEKMEEILTEAGVNLILDFLAFRLGAGPMGGDAQKAVIMLEKLNIPVLHPFFMSKKQITQWQQAVEGINPAEFLVSVMLPELDGCIETIPVGALTSLNSEQEDELQVLSLIEERAERLVERVKNWLKLQQKANHQKKIAILCYNYPPGEANLFGGAFLDTFVSVAQILRQLKANGYLVDDLSAKELQDYFTAGKLVNSGKWTGIEVSKLFLRWKKDKYTEKIDKQNWKKVIEEQWGQAPGSIMTEGEEFLLPGIILGNVFIGLQPSRGIHENPEKAYHDKSLFPHHQYLAFYQWLAEQFVADALIHVGTHGTLEFLPGKECGMSGDCLPDYLIGNLPHIYLYYAGNPSEAMLAKRRSHAVLVSYQPPPFVEGELYGELAELEALIQEYEEAKRISPSHCNSLLQKIEEKATELNLGELNLSALEKELYRLKRSLLPKGLHVFGKNYNVSEAKDYAHFVLRYDRGETKSLRKLLAEEKKINYDLLLSKSSIKELAQLDQEAQVLLDYYWQEGTLKEGFFSSENLAQECLKTLALGRNAYENSQLCHENAGLLRVLNGCYLPAHLAGDMVRNPDVFPTGFNLYQFDPRLIPSQVAVQRGAEIAENTLSQHLTENGCYPQSIAVILWGLETSRTQGETVGQILHYLGVRVNSRKNLFAPNYEIIPLAKLGRPRIDLVVNMCGFFRDMFPNLLADLQRIFQEVASLDESAEENYFKAHTQIIYQALLEQGYEKDDAWDLACARLFGPKEGEYGNNLSSLIETKNWTEEGELAEKYMQSLQHVYSANYRGQSIEKLFSQHLAVVELVSQVRSSHEYEVTDLDHYYEFFGGLAKSVEKVKGNKVKIYISDTTGEGVETEKVEKSIARGVRSRLLNPKWIDGLLEHSYHGGQKIAQRFENLLGLAATTNDVENWIFTSLHNVYVKDKELRRRMQENNRWAYASILESLLEQQQRGYWEASTEEMKQLRDAYLETEGKIEEKMEEEKK